MSDGESRLPTEVTLKGTDLRLRLINRSDRDALYAFACSLPPHDLLFLRRDITQERHVDAWMDQIERGTITTVGAFENGGGIAGYASVDHGDLSWTDHVAELRVLVGEKQRGLGLGLRLTQEAFALALAQGIEKMVAQMTIDQQGAINVFESMGFRPEALLRDHVKDRAGDKHDLLILSQNVEQFRQRRVAFGHGDAFGEY